MLFVTVLLAIIVVIFLWGVAVYNRLVALRNQVKNAFSQIDVQLQRRYDLIPNLVETAKGYMQHERETLRQVIEARNQAHGAMRKVEGDPSNAGAWGELAGAESMLGGALTRFFALAEAYPDLKANQNMAQLQEELATTENRIGFARQAYNDAVMGYNTRRESFPDVVVANNFGFREATLWAMDDTRARAPVKVSF